MTRPLKGHGLFGSEGVAQAMTVWNFLDGWFLTSICVSDFMEADQFPLNNVRQKRSADDSSASRDWDEAPHSRTKRQQQAPYLIFPEILCIIDYDGYRSVFVKKKLLKFQTVPFDLDVY